MNTGNWTSCEFLRDWPTQLPDAFYQALGEFNRREYFACHETLESLWIPERRTVREIYQGVLQIAVGCYHLTLRTNWVGAVNKLDAGARRLERAGDGILVKQTKEYESSLYGVDWRSLVQDADRLEAHLRELGRAQVADYEPCWLPVISYTVSTVAEER